MREGVRTIGRREGGEHEERPCRKDTKSGGWQLGGKYDFRAERDEKNLAVISLINIVIMI